MESLRTWKIEERVKDLEDEFDLRLTDEERRRDESGQWSLR